MIQIPLDQIIIYPEQRQANPDHVRYLAQKIKERGYNFSYPVTLDENNGLVDGGHRVEAARLAGLEEVPFLQKPAEVSRIKHAILCNEDGADTRVYDVFDYAELCWKLSQSGLKGAEISKEIGWNETATVSNYKNIKAKLHPLAWNLARHGLAKNCSLANEEGSAIANQKLAIANFAETHFRALLSSLSLNGHPDRATMRAQLKTIRTALSRFGDPKKQVTAKWIGELAETQAWHIKLAKYMRDSLAKEVPLKEWKSLLKSVKNNVFGDAPTDSNFEKFVKAVATINERVLGVRLYQDDAFQFIPTLKDNSIDMILTDPPYNVTENEWDKIGTDEEYLEWLGRWLDLIKPKLKEEYHLFLCISPHYQAKVEVLLLDKGFPLKSRIVWSHRNLSKGRDVVDKFICMWEMVFHCGTHPLNWSPEWNEERFEVQEWAAPQSNFDDKKQHPTSKPLGLFELFVKVGSKPGDVVLDTFAGGGTAGEACKNISQRQCILVEISDQYCKTIEGRLAIKRVDR